MYIYNGQELSAREIKQLNPDVSYTDPQQVGGVLVQPTAKPNCGVLERATRDGVEVIDGLTYQNWKVVDMFSDYTDEDGVVVTKAEQEAEYVVKLHADKLKEAERAVQEHVNEVVKGYGYDSENSIAKYLVPGNEYYDECRELSLWIGLVWKAANASTATSIEDLMAELPELVI